MGYQVVYDNSVPVYQSTDIELIKSVCEAMNKAHRVGYYDGHGHGVAESRIKQGLIINIKE